MTTINGYEFRTLIAKYAPNYIIDETPEGEVLISTGLKRAGNDYVQMEGVGQE